MGVRGDRASEFTEEAGVVELGRAAGLAAEFEQATESGLDLRAGQGELGLSPFLGQPVAVGQVGGEVPSPRRPRPWWAYAVAGSTWSPTLSVLRHSEQTMASWVAQAVRSGRS